MDKIITAGLCFLGACLSVLGGVFFKQWATTSSAVALTCGFAAYALDTVLWAAFLRRNGTLALGSAIWGATGLLIVTAVGSIAYGERLSTYQYTGIGFVVVGILLC